MDKLESKIILCWEDGHKQEVLFGRNLKGIKHNERRPKYYLIVVAAGTINEVEAARLNEWLCQLPKVIER